MQAFDIHKNIVKDYNNYLKSFIDIKDERIKAKVEEAFKNNFFLPDPLIQFNPSYKPAEENVPDLIRAGTIHPAFEKIFPNFTFHFHQAQAIKRGLAGESFIVTSGTGSGKSLTYLSCIFNRILSEGPTRGVKAIIVYPMNALINSQEEEIKKYEVSYLSSFVPTHKVDDTKKLDDTLSELKGLTKERFPITYARYTGQEKEEQKTAVKDSEPNIILTNYMMLELIMTRHNEAWLRQSIKKNLEFLVFDELHTYRGRQGSDVSMLVRRINRHAGRKLMYVGTSATMSTEGDLGQRKQAVADVAQRIFSFPFTKENIIGETLATSTEFNGTLPDAAELKTAIHSDIQTSGTPAEFKKHLLSIWLENRVALDRVDYQGEINLERGKPLTLTKITELLAADSGEATSSCETALMKLLQWSEILNIEGSKKRPRESFLPFKIHQFISQTGNVYVTLGDKATREITLETGRYLKVEDQEVPIYPVLFSRHSGADFICVSKVGGKLLPRFPDQLPDKILKDDLKGNKEEGLPKRELSEDDFPDGYIITTNPGEVLWSSEDEDFLPDTWYNKKGEIDDFYKLRFPRKIYFDAKGGYSHETKKEFEGWYMPARLLFDPTSGIVYDSRTNENTKLMRLGNEGRSTATTIASFTIVKSLHEAGVAPKNQKLLSFTDNRQDASLQAGHFNDFMMLGRLRSAIYHALKKEKSGTLDIHSMPDRVFKQLQLAEMEYARNASGDPDDPIPQNVKALKDYLTIRILYDLKRGWRYNTPNLEQCGLLKIDYLNLDEICERDANFKGLYLFDQLTPVDRKELLVQILDFFRTSYAIYHPKISDDRETTQEVLYSRLDPEKLWSLDKDERIDVPYYLIPRAVGRTNRNIFTASIGPLSYLGKYLRRKFGDYGLDPLRGDDFSTYVDQLCALLKRKGLLRDEIVRGDKGEIKGYQLQIDSVLWTLGNGEEVMPDHVRVASFRSITPKPNSFFREYYQRDFGVFKRTLSGYEHTGQLGNEDRIDRESRFRAGDISALFCSPTMELGIDISELNVVHMRNVPPNPANYAQRSGRAGRSGQAALVFTYCASGSPHDRNYFSDSTKMVAGAVAPPKIDLTNEELILTHFNAYMLMEMGLQDMRNSVCDVIDISSAVTLPIKKDLLTHVRDQVKQYANVWILAFREISKTIPGLENTSWFSDAWLEAQALSFEKRFNQAFDRWRLLYKSANRLMELAGIKINDPHTDEPSKKIAYREQSTGDRQRKLLMNRNENSFGSESEFYLFRYLASEGFLPGYNFTRLPIRTFLGQRHKDEGEYISRPRFVALKEFGPNNLIYHNGSKYRINRMNITQAEKLTRTLKISKSTGYAFLDKDADGANNDPINQNELKGQSEVAIYQNMLELSESDARPQERISSEEEERTRTGFEFEQCFSFSRGMDATKQTTISSQDKPLLQLIYDQSARLIQINKRWKTGANEEGFSIGSSTGIWKMARDLRDENPDDKAVNVRIFATNTADILYIQPVKELELDENGIITLSYAIKRGIERKFQVEQSEIGVWIMGQQETRNILLYEAAEGSLGIMSELISNGQSLREVFEEAYRVCHFDPITREDIRPDLAKATYEDLLSYYNQRHHESIDRFAIKGALENLLDSIISPQQGTNSYEQQYKYLLDNLDKSSQGEKQLIEYLYKHGLALPDRTQVNLKDGNGNPLYVNADFVYKNNSGYTLVFVDGKPHDDPELQKEDKAKRQKCRDAGYIDIIVWHYLERIEDLIERRKDIFRKVR